MISITLILVDAFNGNAWVSAEYGTTVYLPYPEEVTADTAEALGVKFLHYKDLHREYGISGQAEVEEAINACELEEITVEFDANGIKFDVPAGGLLPLRHHLADKGLHCYLFPWRPRDTDR